MDVLISRQPVMDKRGRTVAYDVKDTPSQTQKPGDDHRQAARLTLRVFSTIGLEKLTGGLPAMVRFSDLLLKEKSATLFDPQYLIIVLDKELKELAQIDAYCRELSAEGYKLALLDENLSSLTCDLPEWLDMLLIDYQTASGRLSRQQLAQIRRQKKQIEIVGLNISTPQAYANAVRLGFTHFHGYYFCAPQVIGEKEPRPIRTNLNRILVLLNAEPLSFSELARIVADDFSLSYHLLKLINSVAFGVRHQVDTIQQALVMLGERESKKFLRMTLINDLAVDQPEEIVRISMIRARFAELLQADLTRYGLSGDDLFLLGLFSLVDVLLGRPLEEIVNELLLPVQVRACLLSREHQLHQLLELFVAYEQAVWGTVIRIAGTLGISLTEISWAYLNAVQWYQKVVSDEI